MPRRRLPNRRKHAAPFGLLLLLSIAAFAQTDAPVSSGRSHGEQNAAHTLELARSNPLTLRAFLVAMPKGADLHNHLTGAVYAETIIKDAADDNLCIDRAQLSYSTPPAGKAPASTRCSDGAVPASEALNDQHLYDALIDTLLHARFRTFSRSNRPRPFLRDLRTRRRPAAGGELRKPHGGMARRSRHARRRAK